MANLSVRIILRLAEKAPSRKSRAILRREIIDAAVIVGSDGNGKDGLTGFLVDLALHHKRAYASLLVKLLPMQINSNSLSRASIGTVNIISVPSNSYLSAADAERLRSPGLVLELPDPELPPEAA